MKDYLAAQVLAARDPTHGRNVAREYVKGRDLYDLLWYLSAPDWPAPNLVLLSNALAQTGWGGQGWRWARGGGGGCAAAGGRLGAGGG